MTKGWTNRGIAKENQYFQKKNQEAIEKIRMKTKKVSALRQSIEIETETTIGGLQVEKELTEDTTTAIEAVPVQKSSWKEALKVDI